MPGRVRITDVSPRDGLQGETGIVPTSEKASLIELLARAGVDEIEGTSFVSPRWVPQLGDADALLDRLSGVRAGAGPLPVLSALVPNEQGMQAALAARRRALDAGGWALGKVAVFTAASETFCRRNTNASIAESLRRFEPVVHLARQHALPVRAYISCAVACPFEGPIAPQKVGHVAHALHDLGVDEIDLGDTIGAAEPESIHALIHALLARLGDGVLRTLTLHLHDTYGHAAECVREALQLGVRSFDGAAGGLGGCPYASTPERRAPGNIATETLVRVVAESGYECAASAAALNDAAAFARRLVGGCAPGPAPAPRAGGGLPSPGGSRP